MKYLKISNKGLLDIEALSLLGASTKRGQSEKIGQFGSGNKFALAYLLRNKYEVFIFSGESEIKISTVTKTFRDNSFEVICFNDKESSITTEFGKDWQLWQSIRELYCNAIDEGDHQIGYVNHIIPEKNVTNIFIKSRTEILNFITSFDEVFAENREILFENKFGKIYSKSSKESLILFRKGIKCLETDKLSLYDYDIPDIDIDENRLAKYYWRVPSQIWDLIYTCTNKDVIRNILQNCANEGFIENISSDFANINSNNISEEFKECIKEIRIAPREMSGLLSVDDIGITTLLPRVVFNQVKLFVDNNNLPAKFQFYKDCLYSPLTLTPLMEATLNKAIDFFKEVNYKAPLKYDIIIASVENKKILGVANIETQEIILSELCLSKGVQCVIETIIEETIHLKYNVTNETRGFQDAAITEILEVLKTNNAYIL